VLVTETSSGCDDAMRAVLPGCYPCAAPARPHAPCHLAAHAAPPSHPPRTVPRCYTAYGPRRRDDQHCGAHSHDHLSPITQCRRTHPAPGAATATSTAWTAEAGPATSTARHRTQSHEHDAACHTCTNRSPVTRRQHNEGGVLGLHDEQRLGQGMDAATRRHEPYAHHMHYSLPPTKHSAIDPTNSKAIPATQHHTTRPERAMDCCCWDRHNGRTGELAESRGPEAPREALVGLARNAAGEDDAHAEDRWTRRKQGWP